MHIQTIAERSGKEPTAKAKLDKNDFLKPFLDYDKKGYKLDLIGKVNVDGKDAFKLSLKKENYLIDNQVVEDLTYYYFDIEDFMLLRSDRIPIEGPLKGQLEISKYADYKKVGDLMFAFSYYNGTKDNVSLYFTYDSFELNPTVENSMFAFPGN